MVSPFMNTLLYSIIFSSGQEEHNDRNTLANLRTCQGQNTVFLRNDIAKHGYSSYNIIRLLVIRVLFEFVTSSVWLIA